MDTVQIAIMNKFRNLKVGEMQLVQTIMTLQQNAPILTSAVLSQAIKDLVFEDYLQYNPVDDPLKVFLTQKGYDFLN